MNLPSVIQCGASPRRPLLEYLPSLGRVTAIHLRIGHPYISPADVRPSNGFGSLAYDKDAAVVDPVVAAPHRQKIALCILSLRVHAIPLRVAPMPAVRYDLNGGLRTCIRFIIYQEYMVIVYCYFFVNLIWYLYLLWLNKHCLGLSLSLESVVAPITRHALIASIMTLPNEKVFQILKLR